MEKHLLSFELRADFACFKKPDVNEGLVMTFNCLHKPALLGILGAITGLKGYSNKGEFPEYYHAFKDLPVSIEPLEKFHDKGNFSKTIIKYTNTVGYANADGNLIVTEQTLVRPGYRCYVLLDDGIEHQATLRDRLLKGESVYLPYLGKNEFSAWWDFQSATEHDFERAENISQSYQVASLFIKSFILKIGQVENNKEDFDLLDITLKADSFIFFERLPVSFDEVLLQYKLESFSYTNIHIKPTHVLNSLYLLKDVQKYVQLI